MSRYKQIKEAVMTAPWLIKGMLDKSKGWDPKLTLPVLDRMLPYRIGIEIECGGSIYNDIENNLEQKQKIHSAINTVLNVKTDYYNLGIYLTEGKGLVDENEHRISITNFRQLIGLYNMLQIMKETCSLYPSGGIHIHVDLTSCHTTSITQEQMHKIKKYLVSKLDYIDSVFKYEGAFNTKEVGINTKKYWINVFTSKKSIEFRTVPQTFDYEELMIYIMTCVKVTKGVYEICGNPKPKNWLVKSNKKNNNFKQQVSPHLKRVNLGKERAAFMQRHLKERQPIKEIEYYI